jgi:hypothetical protein
MRSRPKGIRGAARGGVVEKTEERGPIAAGQQPAHDGGALPVEDSLPRRFGRLCLERHQRCERPGLAPGCGGQEVGIVAPLLGRGVEQRRQAFVGPPGGRAVGEAINQHAVGPSRCWRATCGTVCSSIPDAACPTGLGTSRTCPGSQSSRGPLPKSLDLVPRSDSHGRDVPGGDPGAESVGSGASRRRASACGLADRPRCRGKEEGRRAPSRRAPALTTWSASR